MLEKEVLSKISSFTIKKIRKEVIETYVKLHIISLLTASLYSIERGNTGVAWLSLDIIQKRYINYMILYQKSARISYAQRLYC